MQQEDDEKEIERGGLLSLLPLSDLTLSFVSLLKRLDVKEVAVKYLRRSS